MKYKCIEAFSVRAFDDDGGEIDLYFTIEKGEVYEKQETDFRLIGTPGTIRLENEDGWLELDQETIDTYFVPEETNADV